MSAARHIVPDTSVLIDGRVSGLVEAGELKGARVTIAEASVGELEHLANSGRGIGWAGLKELARLREHFDAGRIQLEFWGQRPTDIEVESAPGGAIDNLVRSAALEAGAELFTSDRVQSEVAHAKGVPVRFIEPQVPQQVAFRQLRIHEFFDDRTFSVHLKEGEVAHAKRGSIGHVEYGPIGKETMPRQELLDLAGEILDFASRDEESYLEMDRRDSRVVQLRNMRVSIAYPPFSDGVEVTAVRPTARTRLEDYHLEPELVARLEDHHRGILISGRPGDGKSTFAQAVAEHLANQGAVVKTMEQPRDMSVRGGITQYSALDGDMALTAEILLLVRPDYVVYDEVRKTSDFETFGDMRLAGVGLVGVTHANRAVDAVQRLIGRVELGIIPQVVDTVIHLVDGQVKQVLELRFTVKVPAGMMQEDLARPVISVTDFRRKRELFEIYTYGEQVVVMPVDQAGGGGWPPGGRGGRAAPLEVKAAVEAVGTRGGADIEMGPTGGAIVLVDRDDVRRVIGPGGETVRALERQLGVRLRVEARPPGGSREPPRPPADTGDEWHPKVRATGKTAFVYLAPELAGQAVVVLIDGAPLVEVDVGPRGTIRMSRRSAFGRKLVEALQGDQEITVRPAAG
jgi:ATPase